MVSFSTALGVLSFVVAVNAQTYSATYLPSNVPPTTEQGQTGTNQCGTAANQTSNCQNVYVNSVDDFCIWGPPEPGADSVIGNTERIEVAWCIKNGTGSRLIPDGAITGAHFVQTPDFVQVTGVGNLTLINIPAGDEGGELDPHGADGNGNPIGGLVFSTAFGQLEQIHEWTNFVAADEFCIRACKPGPMAPAWCEHIYDVMGCMWNMPANYDPGVFENCQGDSGEPMGVYGTSTFFQGEPVTPAAHPVPSSSSCTSLSSIGNGFNIQGTSIVTSSAVSATTTVGVASSSSSSLVLSSSSSTPTSTDAASSASGSTASSSAAISSSSSSLSASVAASSSSSSNVSQGSTSGSGSGSSASRTVASTSGSATGNANNNTNAGFSLSTSIIGWERMIVTMGAMVVGSMLGAVFVL